ncbi:MAG: acyl-CoA thioesterase [Planctomycetota bacterium]|nr:MAG: acyl-CoA thioesterase [Planctomycetota bacterium]
MHPPEVPDSGRLRYRVSLRTRWCDEDNQRLLNNAVLMTLLEEARFSYCLKLDLLKEGQFPFVLAQTNIRFLRPGRGGCNVVVEMATIHLGQSSFRQAYRIRDAERHEVWCEAEALLVAWDNRHRCKMNMESEFRATIAAFEGEESLTA